MVRRANRTATYNDLERRGDTGKYGGAIAPSMIGRFALAAFLGIAPLVSPFVGRPAAAARPQSSRMVYGWVIWRRPMASI